MGSRWADRLSLATGLWGATAGVGIATGPIVRGWLLERFWWGSIFLLLVPVAVVVAVVVAWAVPTSRDPSIPPVDWRGLGLSAAGMGLLVFGVIQAPGWSWGSATTIGVLLAGGAVLAGFVAAERRTAHPMVDVTLFRNPRFTAASGSVAIAFFALLGFIFLMTSTSRSSRVAARSARGSGCCRWPRRWRWPRWPGPGWPCGSATSSSWAADWCCSARRWRGPRRCPRPRPTA